jgi:hypothetical protein
VRSGCPPSLVRSIVSLAFVILLLAAPAVATADVRWAEPDGNGPEPCLVSDPCGLKDAVESMAVADGDEVVMRSGDYDLGAGELEVSDDIVLHGEDGQPRPRIKSTAGGAAVRTNGTGDALIRDLEIVHTGGLVGLDSAVDVERVEVTSDGIAACAPFFPSRIRDSVCRGTGPTGIGLQFSAGGGPPVYDVRAVNVTAIGTAYGIEVDTSNGPNFQINATNVIAQGGTADIRVDTDAVSGADADVILDHSNFQTVLEEGDPAATITDPGTGTNQIAEPLFVDAAGGDFHQLAGSPTRNAGTSGLELGALDIDREPRTQESAPDIGADEFAAVPVVVPVPPSNLFTIGGLRGRILTLNVQAAGTVVVTDAGAPPPGNSAGAAAKRRLKRSSASGGPGTIQVGLRLTKAAKQKLRQKGKVTVNARITFTPTGGSARSLTAKLRVKKKK